MSPRERSRAGRGPFALALLALLACGPKEPAGPAIGVSTKDGAPLPPLDKATAYAFDPLDERGVSSELNRGKPTVLVFVTTGDIVGTAGISPKGPAAVVAPLSPSATGNSTPSVLR